MSEIELQAELWPELVDSPFNLFSHLNFAGPRPGETFGLPLSGSIDPHFGAKIRQAGRVVELVDRTQHELNVAFRIDVVQHLPRDSVDVANVDIPIHDDYAFG